MYPPLDVDNDDDDLANNRRAHLPLPPTLGRKSGCLSAVDMASGGGGGDGLRNVTAIIELAGFCFEVELGKKWWRC